MACEAVQTGTRFVAQAILNIDCQAQAIGAYGFGALSDPNSFTGALVTGLLTLFVALFGLRLMMGEMPGTRGLVSDMLRIGIVLTLATSWPAWRTLGYDVAIRGPGELVSAIGGGAADLPGARGDYVARMQAADDGIVLLTVFGTGRSTGGDTRTQTIGDSFRGIALGDLEGLSSGRIAFLVGTLAPLAFVRLGAGLLLALAPLMAGLLLFAGTRDLFFGWLRALGAVTLGAVALAVISGAHLVMLEPWLRDALALRDAAVLTPSAPTELVAINYTFALAGFATLALVVKIMFFGGFPRLALPAVALPAVPRAIAAAGPAPRGWAAVPAGDAPSRAFLVAEAVSQTLRREDRLAGGRAPDAASLARGGAQGPGLPAHEALGGSFRGPDRRRHRASAAGDKRDLKA